jgi:hypothetical protein
LHKGQSISRDYAASKSSSYKFCEGGDGLQDENENKENEEITNSILNRKENWMVACRKKNLKQVGYNDHWTKQQK